MGIFSRRIKVAHNSPYGLEEAIESTSSFGSISCTPGATSRLNLFYDEPQPLSAASSSSNHLPFGASLPPSPSSSFRPPRRLHASVSHHNLNQSLSGLHPRPPPPLPSLPPHSHSLSHSHSYQPRPPTSYHYVPTKSTPNLLQSALPPLPPSPPRSGLTSINTASRASLRRNTVRGNKEASASRVSLANVASAGRTLARVPSIWKSK